MIAEDEIRISVTEQKAARKALSAEESVDRKRKHALDTCSAEKRVKFGTKNKAKSWKASMKALQTMESPVTDRTPEKSILLNKVVKKKNTKKLKKAADYFAVK